MRNKSFPGHCESLNQKGCVDGILLPTWKPVTGITPGDRIIRAAIYFILMCYLFLGVSIIADKFMAAIEMITSQERKYRIKKSKDVSEVIYMKVWNETVSNLTLMALGSSAPEILLSIIEIIGKRFEAGELGPGTIVGSAAFNLFIIIGICVVVVPKHESRKTKNLTVFIVTTVWSLFAYIWMYVILSVISPGIVEVWEALLTFIFFPLTVISAYLADIKLCGNIRIIENLMSTSTTSKDFKISSKSTGNDFSTVKSDSATDNDLDLADRNTATSDESDKIDQIRMEYLEVIKDLRHSHSNLGPRELELLAESELFKRKTKSRAYYRMEAMRYITGNAPPIKKLRMPSNLSDVPEIKAIKDKNTQQILFSPDRYTVLENEGKVTITVKRIGILIESTVVEVDYFTEDGTAKKESDYVSKKGKLRFECGKDAQNITVEIIDDDVFEEDEHFFLKLKNPVLIKNESVSKESFQLELGSLKSAAVMILDDDYGGTFHFEETRMTIIENIGNMEVKVIRSSGGRGEVRVPYKAINDTAINGIHYQCKNAEIMFKNNQTEHFISIPIVDENEYEKSLYFFLELGVPIFRSRPSDTVGGSPRLGENKRISIEIVENPIIKRIIDSLIERGKIRKVIITPSWKEQFREALTVVQDTSTREMPQCSQYVLHYLSIFWKVLFALVPPPSIWNGWMCFLVSILIIGILTTFIGDLASFFGCHVGLSDSVTAITFVALGTSLPDTFASKVAAINDKTADASIGNVMGSNAVNVFLGIGTAWSIAAVYHNINNSNFFVASGSLGFSVTLFTILALIALSIMLIRRIKQIGGELGGPTFLKYATGIVFCLLWLLYLIISSLEIYCHIDGF